MSKTVREVIEEKKQTVREICRMISADADCEYTSMPEYKNLPYSVKTKIGDYQNARFYIQHPEKKRPEPSSRHPERKINYDMTIEDVLSSVEENKIQLKNELFDLGTELVIDENKDPQENIRKIRALSKNIVSQYREEARYAAARAYNTGESVPVGNYKDDLRYKFLPSAYKAQVDELLSPDNQQRMRNLGNAQNSAGGFDIIEKMDKYKAFSYAEHYGIVDSSIPEDEAFKLEILDAIISTRNMQPQKRKEALKEWVVERKRDLSVSRQASSHSFEDMVEREM